MLVSRTAELEKRNRIAQKGKDGGSFIPRAIVISGTNDDSASTRIALPAYINFNNFLSATYIYDGQADPHVGAGEWVIGDTYTVDTINILYNANLNTIEINEVLSDYRLVKFKLTVFYKG